MPFGQIEALAHNGLQLALERQDGATPTFVWLGGFKSDMAGQRRRRSRHGPNGKAKPLSALTILAMASRVAGSTSWRSAIGWATPSPCSISERRGRSFWSDHRWAAG